MRSRFLPWLVLTFLGCSSAEEFEPGEDGDAPGEAPPATTPTYAVGTKLVTTADLNLRKEPVLSDNILRVIPRGSEVEALGGDPKDNFFFVRHMGLDGWASAKYLRLETAAPIIKTRAEILERAKPAVGFSYWWGKGRWLTTGPTDTVKGACTGSCPDCSHSGEYGADCSGFVAKVWGVPDGNDDVTVNSHPYSTVNFTNEENREWHTVKREEAQAGDAFTYNEGNHGHIFLYEKGDPWGSVWAYEARGCSYGIPHNLRTTGSRYKVIAKDGI